MFASYDRAFCILVSQTENAQNAYQTANQRSVYVVSSPFGVRMGSFKVTLPIFTPLSVFFYMVQKDLPTEFISEHRIPTAKSYFCELKAKTTFQNHTS